MPAMKYKDYLQRLADQFESQMKEILVEHNFDYGPEFEIALCKMLRKVLPQKYGVCRGFVVAADVLAGDDIIIYDRDRFPTLRFLEQDQYENKEYIPVEAVYAYIEAKYTLNIGEGKDDGQSFLKARAQIADVKRLPRQQLPIYQTQPGWPRISNPLFCAIFARRVRIHKNDDVLTGVDTVNKAVVQLYDHMSGGDSILPDLVVVGDSVMMTPMYKDSKTGEWTTPSPFFIEGSSALINVPTPGHAFAIGLMMLSYALDTINLGRLPWHELLNEAFSEAQKTHLKTSFGIDL